jgi:hypothetical protein
LDAMERRGFMLLGDISAVGCDKLEINGTLPSFKLTCLEA